MSLEELKNDPRIVLTLDAGGTNLVFSAIRGNREIVTPVRKPTHSGDLDRCLDSIIQGFTEVETHLPHKPVAISFAFPGPADYLEGIIGDLPNFRAFTGGVALGPLLEDRFGIPVYINNDGNLFAYGEALAGYLPWLNQQLALAGSTKRYRNLLGFTLGTGFGSGLVLDQSMYLGHSTGGVEIHNTLNQFHPEWNAEESVSTRAIQRVYAEAAGLSFDASLMPRDIYDIAKGIRQGEQGAALESFDCYGRSLGNSVANALSLFDGIVVLGGGITAAWDLIAAPMFTEIRRTYRDFRGVENPRLSFRVYNLENGSEFDEFTGQKAKELKVPGSKRKVLYDGFPRTGVALSKLGTSEAIALGAYTFALQQLET